MATLAAGQRFRMLAGGEEIWRVLHVNDSRAHCASEKQEQVTMGDRSFVATSRRTIDISPNSIVEFVDASAVPEPVVRQGKSKPVTPGAYVIRQGDTYLRRVQISQAPGYRYDHVSDRGRATEYKSMKGAVRSFEEFEAGTTTGFAILEG
jgi:hypothetical protein